MADELFEGTKSVVSDVGSGAKKVVDDVGDGTDAGKAIGDGIGKLFGG